jgi:hypothetical protein
MDSLQLSAPLDRIYVYRIVQHHVCINIAPLHSDAFPYDGFHDQMVSTGQSFANSSALD